MNPNYKTIKKGSRVRVIKRNAYKHYNDIGIVTGVDWSYAFVKFPNTNTKCKYLIKDLQVISY